MSSIDLPGVTLDAKAEDELSAAFGVTSNAEELVRQNRARYTTEQRAALVKQIDPGLTSELYVGDPEIKLDPVSGAVVWDYGARRELKPELAEAVGVQPKVAVVRGSGPDAAISYVYESARGTNEKDVIPFAAVFGNASSKREASEAQSPEGAAQSVLGDAEREASKLLGEARTEIEKLVDEARAKAQEILKDAETEAQKLREEAAAEAPKAAEKAEEDQAKESGSKASGSKRGGRKAS